VVGAITAIAEVSPAITWSRVQTLLAFVYYEKGDNTVWRVPNPRSLKKEPFWDATKTVVANKGTVAGSTTSGTSTTGATTSAPLVAGQAITAPVAHLPAAAVGDTTQTRTSVYRDADGWTAPVQRIGAEQFAEARYGVCQHPQR